MITSATLFVVRIEVMMFYNNWTHGAVRNRFKHHRPDHDMVVRPRKKYFTHQQVAVGDVNVPCGGYAGHTIVRHTTAGTNSIVGSSAVTRICTIRLEVPVLVSIPMMPLMKTASVIWLW